MALTAAHLIKASKTVLSLMDFVEAGGLADLMAEIELTAAEDAFRKATTAKNRYAQIWTAIGHLESSFHATMASARQEARSIKSTVLFLSQLSYIGALKSRAKYTLCLMAAAYFFVGEYQLSQKQLNALESVDDVDLGILQWLGGTILLSVTAPLIMIAYKVQDKKYADVVSKEEVETLKTNLCRLIDSQLKSKA